MGHGRRFFCPTNLTSPPWKLCEDEARHIRKVLRLQVNDKITLVDGQGGWVTATLKTLNDREAVAEPLGPPRRAEPPILRPHLLVASPDPKVMDQVLEHAVELGAWRVAIAVGARSPAPFEALVKREARFQTLMRSAVKQSGNLFLPGLGLYPSIQEALASLPTRGWLFKQDAPPFTVQTQVGDVLLAIGPEGDFTEGETEMLLRQGLHPAALGPYTQRVETAALSALALLGPVTLQADAAKLQG
ncbi:MAG: 16S rRNA (uracil(1498)-N(3))-methyltransferase [Acidobacteria bacterium]|jgi:16S rRNA (uracil1498-N3)-methyltransferase|nr:16S rRNA (uracil(1498)-N(3))-methyltransferase [Acidobacteriota bacterium]